MGQCLPSEPHFNFLLKDSVSKYSHILRVWELGFQHLNLREIQFSPWHCVIKAQMHDAYVTWRLSQSQTRSEEGPHFKIMPSFCLIMMLYFQHPVSFITHPLDIVVAQSFNRVQLSATQWTAARQASLSFTILGSLLKLMSIESVMPCYHLVLRWRWENQEGKKIRGTDSRSHGW